MVLRTLHDVVVFEMDVTTHVLWVVVAVVTPCSGVVSVCVILVETQFVQITIGPANILVVDQMQLHMIAKEL